MFDIAADKIKHMCRADDDIRKPCITGTLLARLPLHSLLTCDLASSGDATTSMMWDTLKYDVDPTTGVRLPVPPERSTPGLLFTAQPNAKIIIILRDPVERCRTPV